MNFSQFFLILRARRRLIGIVLLLGLLATAAWIAVSQRTYKATAQVLVNVRAPDTVTTTGDPGVASQLQPDYLTTQTDVINSDRVALTAVKKLGIADDPASLDQYRAAGSPGSPASYFADQLRTKLEVLPSAQSRVIAISYTSPDPQAAAQLANAFAEAYRDVSLDLQAEPARQASGFYEKAIAGLRDQLAAAQEKLSKRRAELGVTAVAEQVDADDARLGALSQQLAAAQAQRAAQGSRAGGGSLPDAMMSPVVQGLQADIARLEAQRRQLATFAGPNNVDYQQITAQLSTLRAELAKQRALVAQSTSTASAQSAASVAGLQAALDAQRARVIGSQRSRGEIAALEQDVLNLRQAYQDLNARKTQATLLGAASQTNISILSAAPVPLSPSGVPWMIKLLAGVAFSILLAIGAAIVRELLDPRLRMPDDAAVWLGIPNLGGVRSLAAPPPRMIGQSFRRYLPGPSEREA